MTRDDEQRRIQDYLDDRLSADERARFESRLREDEALSRAVDEVREIGELLRDAPAELPPGFYTRAKARFEASTRRRSSWRRLASWEAVGLAAAAVLLAAILVPYVHREGVPLNQPVSRDEAVVESEAESSAMGEIAPAESLPEDLAGVSGAPAPGAASSKVAVADEDQPDPSAADKNERARAGSLSKEPQPRQQAAGYEDAVPMPEPGPGPKRGSEQTGRRAVAAPPSVSREEPAGKAEPGEDAYMRQANVAAEGTTRDVAAEAKEQRDAPSPQDRAQTNESSEVGAEPRLEAQLDDEVARAETRAAGGEAKDERASAKKQRLTQAPAAPPAKGDRLAEEDVLAIAPEVADDGAARVTAGLDAGAQDRADEFPVAEQEATSGMAAERSEPSGAMFRRVLPPDLDESAGAGAVDSVTPAAASTLSIRLVSPGNARTVETGQEWRDVLAAGGLADVPGVDPDFDRERIVLVGLKDRPVDCARARTIVESDTLVVLVPFDPTAAAAAKTCAIVIPRVPDRVVVQWRDDDRGGAP